VIPVTKPFLPPIEEYTAQVQRAYDKGWLTNRGELVLELEQKLTSYLGLERAAVLCMNNGTVPIQIALKLLGNGGEVITTAFSYVATSAAIVWENCTPVFVDIHPEYLTIDETKIEAAITKRTTCILATHVFGNPCNVEVIEAIARKHKLSVIYDAAHCFGVKYQGKSIFEFGDISTCSFHATKLFHTGEGGAVFCSDTELNQKIYYSHNFGHNGPIDFHGLGINGKISELNAAMGLSVLRYMDDIIDARRNIARYYFAALKHVQFLRIFPDTDWNYSYFPIICSDVRSLLQAQQALLDNNIVARRYFYPSLNKLPYVESTALPITESISNRILCLPVYFGLEEDALSLICNVLNKTLNSQC
jgi:dTDP-4-amino-4,6-dideoxygalactose transaminase